MQPEISTFPMAIDSTMRAAFVSCPYKFAQEYLNHWKPRNESPDLVAGKAFAAGLEAARRAFHEEKITSPDECIGLGVKALLKEWGDYEPPERHPKQLDRMIGALDAYFQHYGFATDYLQPYFHEGKPALEFSFALPIPGTSHPETGDPILYTGRFDMLGVYNGSIFVEDDKTTRQLGQSWTKNWVLRSQLTGYCWAAKQFGYPVAGAIIRGISILMTKYGHAEVLEYRPDWMIQRWLEQLRRDINRMIQCWREGYWDWNLDTSCANYGGCLFLDVCNHPDPDRILEENFVRRIWDPLAREEIALEEKKDG